GRTEVDPSGTSLGHRGSAGTPADLSSRASRRRFGNSAGAAALARSSTRRRPHGEQRGSRRWHRILRVHNTPPRAADAVEHVAHCRRTLLVVGARVAKATPCTRRRPPPP